VKFKVKYAKRAYLLTPKYFGVAKLYSRDLVNIFRVAIATPRPSSPPRAHRSLLLGTKYVEQFSRDIIYVGRIHPTTDRRFVYTSSLDRFVFSWTWGWYRRNLDRYSVACCLYRKGFCPTRFILFLFLERDDNFNENPVKNCSKKKKNDNRNDTIV